MIRPFGEAAFLVELASASRAQVVAASLRGDPVAGTTGVVPGRASVVVEFDPLVADPAAVEAAIAARVDVAPATVEGRLRRIPVVYGGSMGPDLPEVAALLGLTEAEVIERHASTELTVLFGGFAPGFAYLGDLPDELRVPRLGTPRTRTPAGSVALADGMSGIYPAELPGGWRVIGRTPIALFDPRREPPAYLVPGDRIRFEAVGAADAKRRAGAPADW